MYCVSGEVGKRLKIALEARFPLRAIDLARALNVKPQRLNGWLVGNHDPSFEFVIKAAEFLRISRDWLLGEMVPMNLSNESGDMPITRTGIRFVPVYGAISAGSGGSLAGDVVEWYEMKDWGPDFERWFRVVKGFSMEDPRDPEGSLCDGDLALIENRQYEPGHIVHAFNAGDDTIKQFRRIDGAAMLCPKNPEFESFSAESWHIKGVCIGFVRKYPDGSTVERMYPSGMRPRTFL